MIKVTLIIITHNRPNRLRRLLDYYQKNKEDFRIIVSDSSSSKDKEKNKTVVSLFPNLDITYLHHYSEDTEFRYQANDTLNYVKTKYCLICPDDDFVVPNAIIESANFLERNLDFTIAQGKYLSFYLKVKGKQKKIYLAPAYSCQSITNPDSLKRLEEHLSNYSTITIFGVHRTEFMKMLFSEILTFTDDERFAELLHSVITIIHGKMKCLDLLYGVREIIPSSSGITNETIPMFIKKGTYKRKYNKFKECLVNHVIKETGVDVQQANNMIDESMAKYLHKYFFYGLNSFSARIVGRSLNKISKKWYKIVKKFLIERKIKKRAKYFNQQDSFSRSLLNPSLKYYKDFNRIYKFINLYIKKYDQ